MRSCERRNTTVETETAGRIVASSPMRGLGADPQKRAAFVARLDVLPDPVGVREFHIRIAEHDRHVQRQNPVTKVEQNHRVLAAAEADVDRVAFSPYASYISLMRLRVSATSAVMMPRFLATIAPTSTGSSFTFLRVFARSCAAISPGERTLPFDVHRLAVADLVKSRDFLAATQIDILLRPEEDVAPAGSNASRSSKPVRVSSSANTGRISLATNFPVCVVRR